MFVIRERIYAHPVYVVCRLRKCRCAAHDCGFGEAAPGRSNFSEAVWKGRNSGAKMVSEEAVVHAGCASGHSPR